MTDLPAGRELDALVAEKVMGWTVTWEHCLRPSPTSHVWVSVGDPDRYRQQGGSGDPVPQPGHMHRWPSGKLDWRALPYFSEDIAAAWAVWEKLSQRPERPALLRWWVNPEWWAISVVDGDDRILVEWAETAPLAIVRGALKAAEGFLKNSQDNRNPPA